MELNGFGDGVRIGEGGLGDVYRAVRLSTGAPVAIKVLRDWSDQSSSWRRAERELRALVDLQGHPHVIHVEEVLEVDSVPYLVMEFAPGGSLAELVADRGAPLSVPEAVLVGEQTSSALVAAHRLGIIHLDIKPQNLLIGGFGQIKVCDFGIAALTDSEEFHERTSAVSYRYASPEQLNDTDVGSAADVYSLGATIVYLLTGKPIPVVTDTTAPRRLPELPRADDNDVAVNESLRSLLESCLRFGPASRPDAADVHTAFSEIAVLLGSSRAKLILSVGATVMRRATPTQPRRISERVDRSLHPPLPPVGPAEELRHAPEADAATVARHPPPVLSVPPPIPSHSAPSRPEYSDATIVKPSRGDKVSTVEPSPSVTSGERSKTPTLVLAGGVAASLVVLLVAVVLVVGGRSGEVASGERAIGSYPELDGEGTEIDQENEFAAESAVVEISIPPVTDPPVTEAPVIEAPANDPPVTDPLPAPPPVTEVPPPTAGPTVPTPTVAPRISSRPFEQYQLGLTTTGQPVIAYRGGTPGGRVMVVVGGLFAGSRRGETISNTLVARTPPEGIEVFIVPNPNVSGSGRLNPRRVNINRNFPSQDWSLISDPENASGAVPNSEVETQNLVSLFSQVNPSLVVVLSDSSGGAVDANFDVARQDLMLAYAEYVGVDIVTVSCPATCTGTLTNYVNDFHEDAFFVGVPPTFSIDRYVDGLLHIAGLL